MPWAIISMRNIWKQQFLPWLQSGHDAPFVPVCICWSYAFPFMGLCFSVCRRFFFSGLPALSYLGYNCAKVLNIHIFFFSVSVFSRICWSQFIDALSNRVNMVISSRTDEKAFPNHNPPHWGGKTKPVNCTHVPMRRKNNWKISAYKTQILQLCKCDLG